MAFQIISFANITKDHFYYFVDRFTLSTNRDLFDALFYTPDDEYEPKVQLEIEDGVESFRFKVNVKDFGSFVFCFNNADLKERRIELFSRVKELRDVEDSFAKTKSLLKIVSTYHPFLMAFYDERKEEFDYLGFRKLVLSSHVQCKVLIFRAKDLEGSKAKKTSYKESFKKFVQTTKKTCHAIKVGTVKTCHAIKVAAVKTAHAIKVAAIATGHFFKKVGHAFASIGKWVAKVSKATYHKVLVPIGHVIVKACKAIWKGLKFVFIPFGKFMYRVGIWIVVGLEFAGYFIKKFFKWVGRGISKVSPKFLPFMGRVFKAIGKGIAIAAVFLWKYIKKFSILVTKGCKKIGILIGKGCKKLGILIGRFFKWLGPILWRFIKWVGKWLWRFIKWCANWIWIFLKWVGRWLLVFIKWLGRQLKKFFIWVWHGIKKFPSYLEWQNDYLFYFMFAMLFSFAFLAALVWAMNGDPLSVFFFVMTALFILICVYATYVHRADKKNWTITIQNVLTPNLAIFFGLTAGVISSFFTSKSIIKLAEGQTLDFVLALWITIGVSLFVNILLNFTPFIIHHVKLSKQNKNQKVETATKTEEKPEIAGENIEKIESENNDEKDM